MSSDWNATSLRELLSIRHGFAFKGEYFVDEETSLQLTTPGNFAIGGGFQNGKGKYYAGPVPLDYVLQAGDLIVTMTDLSKAADTLGYAAVVPSTNGTTWLHNQRVGLVRPREGVDIDMGYIHYLMRSPDYRRWVVSTATGSTVKHTSPDRILDYEFKLPTLAEQNQIGEMLTNLDDHIILLRETNATLEAIAQALFKSWFIDFDPVHAKAEGRQLEGMDAAIAALFPSYFEESELGLIPKGWEVGCVGDLAAQKKGTVNPLVSPQTLFEHYSLPAFDAGQSPVLELGQEIKSNKTPLPDESVLLSKLNPHIPRVWLPVFHGPNAVCSTEFLAYSPRPGTGKELIYSLFCSDEFQQQLCQLVTGTSNSHQRVKPDQVLAIKLSVPSQVLRQAFVDVTRPIFEQVYSNRRQAQTLTELRDTLLPRLISGQLRLPESEVLVAGDTRACVGAY